MTKINICIDPEKEIGISGYGHLALDNISNIVNGSAEDIIFKYADEIDPDVRSGLTVELLKKIRHQGTLTLEFLNVGLVGKNIYNGSINGLMLSKIMGKKKSFIFLSEIEELIESIPKFFIKNKYNMNNNIVVVIIKDVKS